MTPPRWSDTEEYEYPLLQPESVASEPVRVAPACGSSRDGFDWSRQRASHETSLSLCVPLGAGPRSCMLNAERSQGKDSPGSPPNDFGLQKKHRLRIPSPAGCSVTRSGRTVRQEPTAVQFAVEVPPPMGSPPSPPSPPMTPASQARPRKSCCLVVVYS